MVKSTLHWDDLGDDADAYGSKHKSYSGYICEWESGTFDMTDNDNDGLPDDLEVNGIVLQTGRTIYTNPNKADSDGDGLKDGEEIIISSNDSYMYFMMKSNPNKNDSDGDGIEDKTDIYPLNKQNLIIKGNYIVDNKNQDDVYATKIGMSFDYSIEDYRNIWITEFYTGSICNINIQNEFDNNKAFKDDVLVIDRTNENEINYIVYNSYKYTDMPFIMGTVMIINKYNDSLGRTTYERTKHGLFNEWEFHNFLYLFPFGENWGDAAKHADLDSDVDPLPWILSWLMR